MLFTAIFNNISVISWHYVLNNIVKLSNSYLYSFVNRLHHFYIKKNLTKSKQFNNRKKEQSTQGHVQSCANNIEIQPK